MTPADDRERAGGRRAVAVLDRVEPVVLAALPAFMFAVAVLDVPNAALVTTAAAVAALVPFFARFELAHLRAREFMPIVVMSALAVAGRLVFAPVPAIKPMTAIVIVTGLSFGRQNGFVTGALTMLVSNVFFGQGPWTPWQMYCMGLVGYLAGVAGERGWLTRRWSVAVFGFVMVYVYGFILDTWTLVGFVGELTVESAAATYLAGFFFNLAHAAGTVVFLLPIAATWPRMFARIRRKYGIGMPEEPARAAVVAAAGGRPGTEAS